MTNTLVVSFGFESLNSFNVDKGQSGKLCMIISCYF